MELSQFHVSAKMRDIIAQIASGVVEKMRPADRYGVCMGIDYGNKRASILFNGDLDPVNVPIADIWPDFVGQTVRVSGNGTDRYISAAIGARAPFDMRVASGVADEIALCQQMKPSFDRPLLVYRSDRSFQNGEMRLTADGYTWREIQLAPALTRWVVPAMGSEWSNYGSAYAGIGYAKTNADIVALGGLVKGGSGVSTIFQLPPGFRPEYNMIFLTSTSTSGSGGSARVDVMTNGDVIARNADSGWTSLDGIMFPAAGSIAWNDVTFVNGWSAYQPETYGPPAWGQDRLGRVWFRGMPMRAAGAPSVDTPMIQLPADLTPHKTLHFAGLAGGNVQNGLDVAVAGSAPNFIPGFPSIRFKTGSTTWQTLSNIMYAPDNRDNLLTVAYENSWSSYGALYPDQSYQLHRDGIVRVEGHVKGGSLGVASGTIPVGVRPGNRRIFTVNAQNAWGRTDVHGNGTILQMTGSVVWRSENQINFLVEA